jgi:signal transduction histidine kinase
MVRSDDPELLAHELRGPLAAIVLSSEALVHVIEGQPSPKASTLARALHQRARWLQALTENLLTYGAAPTEHLSLDPQSTDLVSLLKEVASILQPLLDAKNQELRFWPEASVPPVRCDARRVGQVFTNLLLNATRFTDVEAPIDVKISTHSGCVCVEVYDRGPGIPLEQVDRLFEPYFRFDPISGKNGHGLGPGLGLGLAVVKAISDAHGGRVGADNWQNGARFWFELPLAARQDDAPTPRRSGVLI